MAENTTVYVKDDNSFYTNYNGTYNVSAVYDPKQKQRNASLNMRYMLCRLRRMFKLEGLPETIPERDFILMLMTSGHIFFTKVGEDYYVFKGSPGGPPDPYYKPTLYVVANPALKLSKSYEIGKEGVMIKCNSLWISILPLLSKYCYLIAENELTMDVVDILARSSLVMSAEDESDYRSAVEYINGLEKGDLSVITRESLVKEGGVDVQPGATQAAQVLTHLIEMNQYFKASMYNEFGLNANWNAKRETITSSETLLNQDTLWPLCDDMLTTIQEGLDEVNELYGLNITIGYNSSWEANEEEEELTMEAMENEAENGGEQEEDGENVEEKEQEAEEDDTTKKDEET